jgi:hypothetical protein
VEKESTTYFFDEFEPKHTLRDDAEREIGRGTSQDNNSTFSFTRCFNIYAEVVTFVAGSLEA